MTLLKRSLINPVLFMTSGLTVLSGLFLMFHYESHFAKAIHQLGGMLLVIFAAMHLIIHWKALTGSLRGRFMLWTMLVFAVCAVIMAATGTHTPHNVKRLLQAILS